MVFPARVLAQRAPLARRLRIAQAPLSLAAQRFQAPARRRQSIRTIATTRPRFTEPTSSGNGSATSNSSPSTSTPSTSTGNTSPASSTTPKNNAPSNSTSATKATPAPAKKVAPARLRVPARPNPPPAAVKPAAHPDVDWASSYYGVAGGAFSPLATAVLRRPLDPEDVEIKPDGIVFLPEIKYRSILLEAFGAGGWGMVPKGEPIILNKLVVREWALVVNGRFVSQSRGENNYFGEDQIPRAIEATKSNALMRCCKDLGVAAELWDRRYVNAWKEQYCDELWVEHVVSKKRARIFLKKGDKVEYPFKISGSTPQKR